ncbi:MAG: hypothetical protein NT090_03230, partial [Acidobacteria bacterium]|nr:hypothetical protein [Acidobacteriota bacterium]
MKIACLSSRTYAGYAKAPQNPEPHSYESGSAPKWMIAGQVAGYLEYNHDPARGHPRFPWVAWGPYLSRRDRRTPARIGLRRQIAQKRQALARVDNRLRHTPSRISAQKAEMTRELLREDRRLLVNALKLAAGNSERALALRFDRHYKCSKDVFSVFRALLQSPGVVRDAGPGGIEVHL